MAGFLWYGLLISCTWLLFMNFQEEITSWLESMVIKSHVCELEKKSIVEIFFRTIGSSITGRLNYEIWLIAETCFQSAHNLNELIYFNLCSFRWHIYLLLLPLLASLPSSFQCPPRLEILPRYWLDSFLLYHLE